MLKDVILKNIKCVETYLQLNEFSRISLITFRTYLVHTLPVMFGFLFIVNISIRSFFTYSLITFCNYFRCKIVGV